MKLPKHITESGLRQLLEEINKYPVLSAKEEVELARRIREKNDNEAKEKFILSNLRFVLHICKNFLDYGLSLSELVNAGIKGLIHAIEKFDERKGYKFSTYSTWWIKREIYKAIFSDQDIIPKSYLARRIKSFIPAFVQENGREPTVQEIARNFKVTTTQASKALTELLPIISLDETFSEDDTGPLIETISIEQLSSEKLVLPSPEEVLRKKQETEKIQEALKKLSPREREIIERNFGLGEYEEQTLEEISRLMNITKERVRQIRDNALKKLRLILPRIK
jgi:RNA polymerase primary sigma factor|uniref:RNA polymerase sigma factor RpoD/SigA n=1 Tax=candidate division WOR-3 bacterium TaxID=2052148 RepID=A0A7V3VT95_UNCW3